MYNGYYLIKTTTGVYHIRRISNN